jgi:hypothetical protein
LWMNKCLERVNDRHFWNPGVFSYAMIPRCRPNSRVFFFHCQSIVYASWQHYGAVWLYTVDATIEKKNRRVSAKILVSMSSWWLQEFPKCRSLSLENHLFTQKKKMIWLLILKPNFSENLKIPFFSVHSNLWSNLTFKKKKEKDLISHFQKL